jgi:hypothetical protein
MRTNEITKMELSYRSNLFTPDLQHAVAPPGSTVSELVAAATRDAELHERVVVHVDGDVVQPEWWSRFRPHPRSRIEITLASASGSA